MFNALLRFLEAFLVIIGAATIADPITALMWHLSGIYADPTCSFQPVLISLLIGLPLAMHLLCSDK